MGTRGPAASPPGPSGLRWSGNLAAYESDRLGFLLRTREEFGGLVTFDVGTTLVHDLDLATEVLRDRSGRFDVRVDLLNRPVSAAEAAARLRDRHRLGPALRPADPALLARRTGDVVAAAVADAVGRDDGRGIDPLPVLEGAIGRVVAEFYFGAQWEPVPAAVHGLLGALGAVFGNVLTLPSWWPSPAHRRVRRRYDDLRRIVEEALRQRLRALGHAGTDDDHLAAVARHALRRHRCDPDAVSHAVVGALLAAYRVPAAAAAWTLLELARSPRHQKAVRRQPGGDLVDAVVTEATRLHPPTWLLRRTASRETHLGGYAFRAGDHFLVSPYVIHRDPAVFDRACDFRPERWADAARSPAAALLTFGHGPHRCPGASLAHTVLTVAITTVLARWQVAQVGGPSVVADPRTTLVPRDLRLRLTPRDAGPDRARIVVATVEVGSG